MGKTLQVIALVYRSERYTRFIADQLKRYAKADGWDVRPRIVANDPEIDFFKLVKPAEDLEIPCDLYEDPNPKDYYLNRVYRCWNFVVRTARADHVCLVNSDMAFSPGWLDALLRHHDGKTTPTSRLVESGKMPSGRHGISKDFGRSPSTFCEPAWLAYAEGVKDVGRVEPGGLFMPVVFGREEFNKSLGYPPGNIYKDGVGTRNGPVQMSGDACYFNWRGIFGKPHKTVFDSLCYHFQTGEQDEK